jgi:hypothetical protein
MGVNVQTLWLWLRPVDLIEAGSMLVVFALKPVQMAY